MPWWRECFENEQAPETNPLFLIKTLGSSVLLPDPAGESGGLYREARNAEGGERKGNKRHPPVHGQRGPKPLSPRVPAAADVSGQEGRRAFPQHLTPAASVPLAAAGCRTGVLLLAAPFKEGFPGIAQSVTSVCFLWSVLLNYFLSESPRNLIGQMRRWARSGRIIKKNCHFPGCSFVGPPAF